MRRSLLDRRVTALPFINVNPGLPLSAKEPFPYDTDEMSWDEYKRVAADVCIGSRAYRPGASG